MSSMCLADVVVWYDLCPKKKVHKKRVHTDLPESDIDENMDDNPEPEEEYDDHKIKLQSGTLLKKRKKKKIIRYVRYNKKKDPENYYREMLMLFYPWTTEDTIIGNSETYEDEFQFVKEDIEAKKTEYEHFAEQLDIAEELAVEMHDETVAPIVQQQELDDISKDISVDQEEEIFSNYDIGPDLGLPSTIDETDELIRNRVTDAQFRTDVRSLNKRQLEIFYHVIKTVKTSKEQFFIFLSGGAGVGKTRVTKTLNQALLRHYNTEPGSYPEQIHILLTAPTGKAAYLIGGRTLHSAFKIPANQSLKHKPLRSDTLNTLRKQLSGLKTLFIDDISMCGINLFTFIDLRLQEVKQVTRPFGGVNLICIGDLFQLPPVMDKWIFQYPNNDYSILAPHVWLDNIRLYELIDIMRQAGDKRFAEALNNMREGNQTLQDIDLISGRIITADSPNYPTSVTHILYYNKSVDAHNTRLYNICKEEKCTHTSNDIVIDVSPNVKKQVLEKAPYKAGGAMGLSKVFRTAVSLRNELTVNLDVADGSVNGAGGLTRKITNTMSHSPLVIWIEFDTEDIGQELRRTSHHLYSQDIERSWTPVTKIARQFPVGKYKNVKIQRKQFPCT